MEEIQVHSHWYDCWLLLHPHDSLSCAGSGPTIRCAGVTGFQYDPQQALQATFGEWQYVTAMHGHQEGTPASLLANGTNDPGRDNPVRMDYVYPLVSDDPYSIKQLRHK